MSEVQSFFTLNNGVKMPSVGLGVLFAKDNGEVERAVADALQIGYRKIDTASAYQNEHGVGQAIKASELERKKVFVTTKVWNTEQGYDRTLFAFEESLNQLQMDYVDLYLIHWPVKSKYMETYRALEQLYRSGRVKAIGVCNFDIQQLENLMEHTHIIPAINQVEMHPHFSRNELLQFAKKHYIQLEAWRPIMMGEVMIIQELIDIGNIHQKSPVQITLRWLIQRGVAVIPKSVTQNRIIHNFDVFDFELSRDELEIIENLNQNRALGEDLSHIE